MKKILKLTKNKHFSVKIFWQGMLNFSKVKELWIIPYSFLKLIGANMRQIIIYKWKKFYKIFKKR